jgi:hypothetical protein
MEVPSSLRDLKILAWRYNRDFEGDLPVIIALNMDQEPHNRCSLSASDPKHRASLKKHLAKIRSTLFFSSPRLQSTVSLALP